MALDRQNDLEPGSTDAPDLPDPDLLDIEEPVHSQPRRSWWWLMGAVVLVIGGVTVWRSASDRQLAEEATSEPEQVRLAVRTIQVRSESIQAWVYGDGFVNAIVKKHLTFQAEGTIEYLRVIDGRDLREGDRVRKGELLARLDRRRQEADITVAQAAEIEARNQVTSAIASFRKAEESLAQAQADLQKAKTDEAFALADFRRYQGLFEDGGIAEREVDVRETEYESAQASTLATEAAVRSVRAEVETAKTQVDIAEAGVDSANAKLSQSFVDREDTELVAPFDGIVSRINIRQGEYWTTQIVSAGGDYQSIIERLPIIVIDPNRFEVDIELPSFQGAQVEPGQEAFIILDRDRGRATAARMTGEELKQLASARGTVFSVSPSVSPGGRSVRVTIRLNEGAENLQDGERVSAWIVTEEKTNVPVAPFNAFISRDRELSVFVVNEETGTVERRPIQQGIEGLTKREILEGVLAGEQLVTDGKTRLVNGAPIEVIP
ncbi:MAG: efflux RND transporter periplasmic adaptor subunit [Cyanobacteria bacterium J06641_5]